MIAEKGELAQLTREPRRALGNNRFDGSSDWARPRISRSICTDLDARARPSRPTAGHGERGLCAPTLSVARNADRLRSSFGHEAANAQRKRPRVRMISSMVEAGNGQVA